MSREELRIKSEHASGMQSDEVSTVLAQARTAGFDVLKRTRVGFKGQILEMAFTKGDPTP